MNRRLQLWYPPHPGHEPQSDGSTYPSDDDAYKEGLRVLKRCKYLRPAMDVTIRVEGGTVLCRVG